MTTCTRCNGYGIDSYEEDNRMIEETCYHCGGSGQIESDELDQAAKIAYAMAHSHVLEYKAYRNNDIDGEGFAFCAAENMMNEYDYFRSLVWDYVSVYMKELAKCTEEQMREYIRKYDNDEVIEPLEST
jgi:hypothetical protein